MQEGRWVVCALQESLLDDELVQLVHLTMGSSSSDDVTEAATAFALKFVEVLASVLSGTS